MTIFAMIVLSALFEPKAQELVAPFFNTGDRLDQLRTIYVTLGGALLGAGAIVFSLVMFAIQVNVERLPHRLFRAMGLDKPLFISFIGAFTIAVAVSVLPLLTERSWVAATIIAAFWGVVLVPIIFVYSYRRATRIINPLQQLHFVYSKAEQNLQSWVARFKRVRRFIEDNSDASRVSSQDSRDYPRMKFFQANPNWCDDAKISINHVVAISKGAAQRGDNEVSGAALDALVSINLAYIEAKGRTFFSQNILIDNPLVTDEFINNSLENLRQLFGVALNNSNETQICQIFRALASLSNAYGTIDYGVAGASKTHANLASAYLGNAVTSVISHKMPDVLMEGVRMLGWNAKTALQRGDWELASSRYSDITTAALAGAVNEEYLPVSQTSMSAYASLAFEILRAPQIDAEFAAQEVNENIKQIIKLHLSISDRSPLFGNHNLVIGPYFSVTQANGFYTNLQLLCNLLINADEENERLIGIIRNLANWSGTISRSHREIFELAVENRSFAAQTIQQWVQSVVTALMAVSGCALCPERDRESLLENAVEIFDMLDVYPEDRDTAVFLANFQWNETLFEVGFEAWQRDGDPILARARIILIKWAFVSGRFETGWPNLEHSLLGLAVLANLGDSYQDNRTILMSGIRRMLGTDERPSQELLDRVARELRGRANTLGHPVYSHSSIENAVNAASPDRMRPMLIELADLISPETEGQASDRQIL